MPESTKALEQLTLTEHWEQLTAQDAWPVRLTPFAGSWLVDVTEEGDSTILIVELSPGTTAEAVYHLTGALASLFDLAVGSVLVAEVPERARRVWIKARTR